MSQVNQLTVHQRLEAAKNTVTWSSHIPALQNWLKENRTTFYFEHTCSSLSDISRACPWIDAPGGFPVGSEIFSEQLQADYRDWWSCKVDHVFQPEQITSLDLIGA